MADNADNDVAVLFPDQDMEVQTANGPESITVREFRFGQTGKVIPLARPIIDELANLGDPDGEVVDVFESIILKHWHACINLMAISIDRPLEWFDKLPDIEGQRVALTFWGVNAPFFTRRLISQIEAMSQTDKTQKSDSPT